MIAGADDRNVAFIFADSPYQDWYSAIFERAIEDYGSWINGVAPAVMLWVDLRANINYKEASPMEKAKMIQALNDLCSEEFEIYDLSQPKSVSHFRDHYDFDLAVTPESPSARIKVRLMEGILKEIKQAGLKHNVRIIIQIQPSAIDLTQNHIISYNRLISILCCSQKNNGCKRHRWKFSRLI